MIYVVRHAKAGSRKDWEGDDSLRPLSKQGWRQADAVAHWLHEASPTRLVSSPSIRCVQTLVPLGRLVDQEVTTDHRLAEGASALVALELVAEVADGAVLCSHGDVIPDLIAALQRRGCEITARPQWGKASTWVLTRDTAGSVTAAAAHPPPDI